LSRGGDGRRGRPLPGRLGAARALVSRSLAQLRAARVIVVRGRRVWLIDERRLVAIADLT